MMIPLRGRQECCKVRTVRDEAFQLICCLLRSELACVGFIISLATSLSSFEWLCVSYDLCFNGVYLLPSVVTIIHHECVCVNESGKLWLTENGLWFQQKSEWFNVFRGPSIWFGEWRIRITVALYTIYSFLQCSFVHFGAAAATNFDLLLRPCLAPPLVLQFHLFPVGEVTWQSQCSCGGAVVHLHPLGHRVACLLSRCMSSSPGVHAGAIPTGCRASICSKRTEAVEQFLLPACIDAAMARLALFWTILFQLWFTEWESSGSLEVLKIKISKLLNAWPNLQYF